MSTEVPQGENKESSNDRWPIGRSIVHRLRGQLNDIDGPFSGTEDGVDVVQSLYLKERDGCLPAEFIGDDILDDIHSLFYFPLDAIRAELQERAGSGRSRDMLLIVVDPSWQDSTLFVMHNGSRVILSGGLKAWNFWWNDEDEMAEAFQDWYQRASGSLPEWQIPEVEAEGFLVTLQLERVIHVSTDDKEEAVDRAVRWEHNEDDPGAQLVLEELNEWRSIRIDPPDQGNQ